jgi:hypothetical protein
LEERETSSTRCAEVERAISLFYFLFSNQRRKKFSYRTCRVIKRPGDFERDVNSEMQPADWMTGS